MCLLHSFSVTRPPFILSAQCLCLLLLHLFLLNLFLKATSPGSPLCLPSEKAQSAPVKVSAFCGHGVSLLSPSGPILNAAPLTPACVFGSSDRLGSRIFLIAFPQSFPAPLHPFHQKVDSFRSLGLVISCLDYWSVYWAFGL